MTLSRLRGAASPWLDGVLIDDGKFSPTELDDVQQVTLNAWMDGERWTVVGTIGGGQGDARLDLSMRLTNALLQARGAPVRVARIGSTELVVAPPRGLDRAKRDSLDFRLPSQ